MATQYYEKNSGLSALFQYYPIYAHVNVDYVILFKKTQARELLGCKLSQRHQILHKNSGLVATQYYEKEFLLFLRYFNMPPFTPMLTQTVLFYLKDPSPRITPVQIIPETSNFAQELRFGGYTIL